MENVNDLERCIICDLIRHKIYSIQARIEELKKGDTKEYSEEVTPLIIEDLEDRKVLLTNLLTKLSTKQELELIKL